MSIITKQVFLQFPFIPVSVNQIWRQGSGRTYKPSNVSVMQRDIEILTRAQTKGAGYDLSKNGVKVTISYYSKSFYNKDGSIRQRKYDLDNFQKILLDSVCSVLGFDDANIVELVLSKQTSIDHDRTNVILEFL